MQDVEAGDDVDAGGAHTLLVGLVPLVLSRIFFDVATLGAVRHPVGDTGGGDLDVDRLVIHTPTSLHRCFAVEFGLIIEHHPWIGRFAVDQFLELRLRQICHADPLGREGSMWNLPAVLLVVDDHALQEPCVGGQVAHRPVRDHIVVSVLDLAR